MRENTNNTGHSNWCGTPPSHSWRSQDTSGSCRRQKTAVEGVEGLVLRVKSRSQKKEKNTKCKSAYWPFNTTSNSCLTYTLSIRVYSVYGTGINWDVGGSSWNFTWSQPWTSTVDFLPASFREYWSESQFSFLAPLSTLVPQNRVVRGGLKTFPEESGHHLAIAKSSNIATHCHWCSYY